jgi:hypothetical protein
VSRVTVYQFTIYDGWNDEFRLSSRWATHEAIESTRIGVIQEHTGTLIDQAHLDENGMTARGFDPAIEPLMPSDPLDENGAGEHCDAQAGHLESAQHERFSEAERRVSDDPVDRISGDRASDKILHLAAAAVVVDIGISDVAEVLGKHLGHVPRAAGGLEAALLPQSRGSDHMLEDHMLEESAGGPRGRREMESRRIGIGRPRVMI